MKFIENYKCKQIQDFQNEKITHLVIMGEPGVGKTYAMDYLEKIFIKKKRVKVVHLNDSKLRTYQEKYPYNVLKIKAIDYCSEMHRELQSFDGDPRAFNKYRNCDVLLFDDFGTEISNERNIEYIYKLLDERKKITLITTNLNLEELTQKYNPRILDRLSEYKFVKFTGDSWRKKNFKLEDANF